VKDLIPGEKGREEREAREMEDGKDSSSYQTDASFIRVESQGAGKQSRVSTGKTINSRLHSKPYHCYTANPLVDQAEVRGERSGI
jgi:hypothetical protein